MKAKLKNNKKQKTPKPSIFIPVYLCFQMIYEYRENYRRLHQSQSYLLSYKEGGIS